MKNDPSQKYDVQVAALDQGGFDKYGAIFEANDMPREDHVLDWRYIDNPARDPSVITLAVERETEDLGAVYAVMGVPFLYDGKPIAGAQSLDTLTDKDHRRRGLFPYLAEKTYSVATDRGCLGVYGFPNANSCPAFAKHLGWEIYGPVDFLVRPLRTGYFLKRLLGRVGLGALGSRLDLPLPAGASRSSGMTLRRASAFTATHTDIWRAAARDVRIAVDRSSDYLNWRVFGRPDGEKYRVLEAVSDQGETLGFVIWTVERKHGGRIGYLMECLVLPGREDARKILLKAAIREMSTAKADVVLAWSIPGQPQTLGLRNRGFVTLPPALRPIQLYWGARMFRDGTNFKKSDWYISYLDSDTV